MGKNTFTKIDLWVSVWFAYYVVNTVAVSHTPCADVFLHTCAWVALYAVLRCLPFERLGKKHWAYLCATLGIWQALMGLMQLLGYKASGHHLYVMTGDFFNPAPFGAFLAVMLAVITAEYKEGNSKILGIAGCLLLIMLPAAWSRAALLAYGVCLAILYRIYIKRYWWMVVIGTAAVLAVLYWVKQCSANSRVLMFIASCYSLIDNLWLGVGTGGYLHALGESQAKYFAENPNSLFVQSVGIADLPFNEPMRMAVEYGVVGLLLMSTTLFIAAMKLWRAGHPLFYGLVALLVFSLFSYPFTISAFCIMLTVMVATAANVSDGRVTRWHMAWPLTIACMLGSIVLVWLLPRKNAQEEYDRFAHIDDESFIDDYYEILPLMNDKSKFLFKFGLLLRNAGRYNDSNAMLWQGTLVSADPMFHILMGRNYEDLHEYAMADSLYAHAFHMVPNRIYPLYRQMKLYERMGDRLRMRSKAWDTYTFDVKVESPATRDIKYEACEIINRVH